jgi:UPF0755 protein
MKLKLIAACVVFAALALGAGLWLDYRHAVDAPLANQEPVYFEISKGQGLATIAEALHERGLIDRPRWFRLLAWLDKVQARLKYGEYEIPPGTTPRQLLALFASGKVRHYSLTFVEGWNFRQIVEALNRQTALVHHVEGKSPKEIMGLIDAPGEDAEGRFYPDTYFFNRGTDDLELLRRAYRKMQAVLAEEWQGRAADLPVQSPYEALILASLVEKETGRADERPRIAGVFSRRLQKGMLLQTDPTVIYGMGEAYAGNIRKEDLLRESPFNTYLHTGLPPTPISMPGLASLRAALHPEPGDSLYFVARGDGGHVFSKTLAEHNQAVDQHQKNHHD